MKEDLPIQMKCGDLGVVTFEIHKIEMIWIRFTVSRKAARKKVG